MNKIKWVFRAYILGMMGLLLVPMLYIVMLSFTPTPNPLIVIPESVTLKHYERLMADSGSITAIQNSLIMSSLTAGISTVLGLLGARGYKQISMSKRKVLLLIYLFPVFIPGIILGLGLLGYFRILNIRTGFTTSIIGLVLWAYPFAVLIIIISLSKIDHRIINASRDLGASPWQTFRHIEFPLIYPGLLGAFLFSFLLSLNEYIRTSFVSGPKFTLPLLMYSQMQGGTIPPQLFAASTIFTVVSIFTMVFYIFYISRG